jgi:hypothetical protein
MPSFHPLSHHPFSDGSKNPYGNTDFISGSMYYEEHRVPFTELSRCRAAALAAKIPLARHAHPRGAFLSHRTIFPM